MEHFLDVTAPQGVMRMFMVSSGGVGGFHTVRYKVAGWVTGEGGGGYSAPNGGVDAQNHLR